VADHNLFASLLGKSDAEIQTRIDSVWAHFFTLVFVLQILHQALNGLPLRVADVQGLVDLIAKEEQALDALSEEMRTFVHGIEVLSKKTKVTIWADSTIMESVLSFFLLKLLADSNKRIN